MSNKKPTNIAASVSARIKRIARERGEDVVLARYANERLLWNGAPYSQVPSRSTQIIVGQ